MRKSVKNQKGFTLIELMMVIAVIGILAAVLIPKMGGIKATAKLSGVDANARQVEAAVQGLIQRYYYDPNEKFADALVNAIDEDIANPFDAKIKGARTKAGKAAVFISIDPPNKYKKGAIHVAITWEDDYITSVEITPYDDKGEKMPPKTITP